PTTAAATATTRTTQPPTTTAPGTPTTVDPAATGWLLPESHLGTGWVVGEYDPTQRVLPCDSPDADQLVPPTTKVGITFQRTTHDGVLQQEVRAYPTTIEAQRAFQALQDQFDCTTGNLDVGGGSTPISIGPLVDNTPMLAKADRAVTRLIASAAFEGTDGQALVGRRVVSLRVIARPSAAPGSVPEFIPTLTEAVERSA
ncbi:MAG: hypothetical protein JWM47_407, partial [Acidimicrobiales bacterium]|nr:hypothetical protein [Acidimicrobiales bacterium]